MSKNNSCNNAPKLKELPEQFSKQVTFVGEEVNHIDEVLRASLPQLAKEVIKANSHGSSYANRQVKAINLATSLIEPITEANESLTVYYGHNGFYKLLEEEGVQREWTLKDKCDRQETMRTAELYGDVEFEIHITMTRKLKDKKFLASKGVK